MEKSLKKPLSVTIRNYCFLTKPGIIFGNTVTASAGFALASKHSLNLSLFIMMLVGLSLVIGSACVFNNYIDRELDSKMPRTQKRALVTGAISNQSAIIFALILGLLGIATLSFFTNPFTAVIALLGLLVYVFVYSFSKYQTHFCTLLGSIAGSVPPLVGYTAITGRIDLCALILFLMITMWQMPHFFAISIYRIEDYAKGEIPVLPLSKGMLTTKLNMLFYIILFMIASFSLYYFNYAGLIFLIPMLSLGAFWFILCMQGFKGVDDVTWARKIFIFSLVIIMAIGITIPFSVIS